MPILFKLIFILIAIFHFSKVIAQDQEPIDISRDWSTFDCYIVSQTIDSAAFKNGEKLSKVSRDKGMFYIQKDQSGQLAGTYFAGFPLKLASQALLIIDNSESFVLYSHLEPVNTSEKAYAWAHPDDDQKLIASLKKGSKAVIESQSHTGKIIKDTFALTGFTSAFNLMQKSCK